jgi:hypothetical protein
LFIVSSVTLGKANLLIRNISGDDKDQYDEIKDMSAHVMRGDTLADDKFEGTTFNYILSIISPYTEIGAQGFLSRFMKIGS